jgi:hypothetical protein
MISHPWSEAGPANISGALLSALVTLANVVHDIRPAADPSASDASVAKLLQLFMQAVIPRPDGEPGHPQFVRDAHLLRQLAVLWGDRLADSVAALDGVVQVSAYATPSPTQAR